MTQKDFEFLSKYNDEEFLCVAYMVEKIALLLDSIKQRISWLDENAKLEDLEEVYKLTDILDRAVEKTEENSIPSRQKNKEAIKRIKERINDAERI